MKSNETSFADALRVARREAGLSQERLGVLLGRSGAAVGLWEAGSTAPKPDAVFELERSLHAPAGSLSRHLGYLPVGPVPTVEDAIAASPRLDEIGRAVMLAALAAAREETLQRRQQL